MDRRSCTILTGLALLLALTLAGCAGGPYPDENEEPEAGYDTITERPPPGAPDASEPYDANVTPPSVP